MEDAHSSEEDEDDGGVHLNDRATDHAMERGNNGAMSDPQSHHSNGTRTEWEGQYRSDPQYSPKSCSRTSSGDSTDLEGNAHDAIFDQPRTAQSSISSMPLNSPDQERSAEQLAAPPQPDRIEVEAVVSCTSDGLVVVLRRARALFPHHVPQPAPLPYANGLFASPWAAEPIMPMAQQWQQPHYNYNTGFQPNLAMHPSMTQAPVVAGGGPATEDFMNSIREVAVFAWSLTGINGSLAQYGRGKPTGESVPPEGVPIWDPDFTGGESDGHDGFQDNQSMADSKDYYTYPHAERSYSEDPDGSLWNRSPPQKTWSG